MDTKDLLLSDTLAGLLLVPALPALRVHGGASLALDATHAFIPTHEDGS